MRRSWRAAGWAARGTLPLVGVLLGVGVAPAGGVPSPRLGVSVVVSPVSGAVFVRAGRARAFQALRGPRVLRGGDEVDATHGRAGLALAQPTGVVAGAVVSRGRFVLQLGRRQTGLRLSAPLSCPAVAAAVSARHHRRALFVTEQHARLKTIGSFASAAGQGTAWVTVDDCRHTTVAVREGQVLFTDLVQRVSTLLGAPAVQVATQGTALAGSTSQGIVTRLLVLPGARRVGFLFVARLRCADGTSRPGDLYSDGAGGPVRGVPVRRGHFGLRGQGELRPTPAFPARGIGQFRLAGRLRGHGRGTRATGRFDLRERFADGARCQALGVRFSASAVP